MKIERHKVGIADLDYEIGNLHEFVDINFEMISKGEILNLSSLSNYLFKCFYLYQYDEELGGKNKYKFRWTKREYLEMALKANLFYWKLVQNPGTEMQLELNGQIYTFVGKEMAYYTGTGDWINSLNLAQIVRNKGGVDQLCEIKESLLRNSELKSDEYLYLVIDFFKSLYQDSALSKEKLLLAYKATDPKEIKMQGIEAVLNLFVPILDLYVAILKNNEKEFNEKLIEQLECHRYIVENKKLSSQIPWLYSVMGIATCAYAHDKGFNITVESPYIPRDIYTGNF